MSWKRLGASVSLSLLVMIGDTMLLALVNKLYRPRHPPGWLIAVIFYFLAWPVTVTQHLFPRAPGGNYGGPTFLAIVSGGLIDLILFTIIVYAVLNWRAKRKGIS